jgi:hypothetical protein
LYDKLPHMLVFYCINNQGEWVKRVEKLLWNLRRSFFNTHRS